jgi:threonine/homoserine/homoserine lactone efflux protein
MHAGFAPGPVSTLLMTESLRHGRRAGIRIAFVPVLTDLPVVAVAIPLLYYLTFSAATAVGIFSMTGSFFLAYLGYESLSVTRSQFERGEVPKVSLIRAVGINFFNPNLYIYWIAVCGPICVTALHLGFGTLFLFLISFYISITSVKIGVALTVGSVRRKLNLTVIIWINRLLGAVMILFAALFFYQGWLFLSGKKSISQ